MANTGAEAFLNLHEVVKAARARTSRDVWDYLVGAAESETTMKRNRLAIDSLGLRPRVLRDVSDIDTAHEFLGRRLRLPIAFAPIGGLQSFDPGGGATVARAAAEFGFVSIHSSVSAPGLEQTAAASNAAKIYQLYVRGDDAWIDDHVARARDAGYAAFCLTVDTAVYSRRERDIANRFAKPWRQRLAGLEYQAALSWDNVKHYKDRHDMPLAIKGISTVEDALLAVEHGCEMVYVSNHGGRQLDQGRGALDVFPDIRDAVAGRRPGRHGTDPGLRPGGGRPGRRRAHLRAPGGRDELGPRSPGRAEAGRSGPELRRPGPAGERAARLQRAAALEFGAACLLISPASRGRATWRRKRRGFSGGLGHFKIGPGHPLPRPNHPWSVPLGWLGRGSGWLGDSDQT